MKPCFRIFRKWHFCCVTLENNLSKSIHFSQSLYNHFVVILPHGFPTDLQPLSRDLLIPHAISLRKGPAIPALPKGKGKGPPLPGTSGESSGKGKGHLDLE